MMKHIALIIAGDRGNRMGQDLPKQFLSVDDKPIIMYTCEVFQAQPDIDAIAIVCIDGWQTALEAYTHQFNITKLCAIVPGGANGQESIYNGIQVLSEHFSQDDIVLVHDAIRPMVSADIISRCIKDTQKYGSSIVSIPCAEAMLEIDETGENSSNIVNRDTLKRTQTPQGFRLGTLLDIHKQAEEQNITNSVASCTLAIELGRSVHFTQGSEKNIKLTTVDDIDIFKALLTAKRSIWLKN